MHEESAANRLRVTRHRAAAVVTPARTVAWPLEGRTGSAVGYTAVDHHALTLPMRVHLGRYGLLLTRVEARPVRDRRQRVGRGTARLQPSAVVSDTSVTMTVRALNRGGPATVPGVDVLPATGSGYNCFDKQAKAEIVPSRRCGGFAE